MNLLSCAAFEVIVEICSCVCVEMFEYVSKYSLIDSDSREAFREMI